MSHDRFVDNNSIHFFFKPPIFRITAFIRINYAERCICGTCSRNRRHIDDRTCASVCRCLCQVHHTSAADTDDQITTFGLKLGRIFINLTFTGIPSVNMQYMVNSGVLHAANNLFFANLPCRRPCKNQRFLTEPLCFFSDAQQSTRFLYVAAAPELICFFHFISPHNAYSSALFSQSFIYNT